MLLGHVSHLATDRISLIIENEPTSGDEQVPHTLVLYMIRSIIRPSFILEQIPDLLDLIATADAFRSHAVEGSSVALLRQEYYAKEPSSHATLLTAKELKKIEGYVGSKESGRMHYMSLVKNLCILHVYYLATSQESCMLAECLNDYFPGCNMGQSIPSKLLFSSGLSDSEKEIMEKTYEECKGLILELAKWEEEQGHRQKQMGVTTEEEDAFLQDFGEKFPSPVSEENLASDIEEYLDAVEEMLCTLEEYFPSSNTLKGSKWEI
ncbi:hypothetical protein DFJ58DRAFT_663501 [Suillus subalutaceus]|uniref:uncharacterized protein n=1 Tax=Suillus subalutaceus TaxID=48586 RepID=UPI001B871B9E|nr:uncharacterized protein DFJ58DRAFT_663501 [Suillus subalutaceus]KAG1846982.1 hypothetical protein DFJ58DRAFT_663501 [Suillus subalutaceus]